MVEFRGTGGTGGSGVEWGGVEPNLFERVSLAVQARDSCGHEVCQTCPALIA